MKCLLINLNGFQREKIVLLKVLILLYVIKVLSMKFATSNSTVGVNPSFFSIGTLIGKQVSTNIQARFSQRAPIISIQVTVNGT